MNTTWTADEMMTIAAARTLQDGNTCFVGIGIPSTAAILAKSMQAPNLFLIYESGTVNTNPQKLPLSIGDGAYTAAGSVITEDVPPGAMGVARGKQRNVIGWVMRKRSGSKSAEAAARHSDEKKG